MEIIERLNEGILTLVVAVYYVVDYILCHIEYLEYKKSCKKQRITCPSWYEYRRNDDLIEDLSHHRDLYG